MSSDPSAPLGPDELLHEALSHLREALAQAEAARAIAEISAEAERERCEEAKAEADRLRREAAEARHEAERMREQCREAHRAAQIAQLLTDRQTEALRKLASENASLLSLLSGLPSLRSAVANGAAPPASSTWGKARGVLAAVSLRSSDSPAEPASGAALATGGSEKE